MSTDPDRPRCPEAVLDTNVLLDWLVFAEPGVAPIVEAIHARRLRWVATPAMLDELIDVLSRPAFQARGPAIADPSAAVAAWCQSVDAPPAGRPPLLCRDEDDQMFIDLALHRRTAWLISRDRALLALARRAGAWGTTICTPQRWIDLGGGATASGP